MKNIIKITIVAAMILVSSCEDFLEIDPQTGQVTDAAYFKTKEDFEAYLFGAYAECTGHFNNSGIVMPLHIGGEIMQDIIYTDQSTKELVSYMSPSNKAFIGLWKTNYNVIAKSNLVLDKLADAPINNSIKPMIEAEAKFLRGFAYYHLASAFGNVPLITKIYETSQNSMECSTEAEVLALVISDLTYASQILPTKSGWGSENLGRATKGAAYAFLAAAYMQAKEWAKAEKASVDLMNLGGYRLLSDVRDVFNPDSPNSDESIFEIQQRLIKDNQIDWGGPAPTRGSTLPVDTAPQNIGSFWAPGGGWGGFSANRKLADSFEPGDERRTKLMVIPGESYRGSRMSATLTIPVVPRWDKSAWSTKYWVGPNPAGSGASYLSDSNIIAMRYAEFLLNYSEILFELGKTDQAYDQLNKIRDRAKLPALVSSGDKATFMTALMKERRWELNFEPNLWYHFMRTGIAADFLQNEYGITMDPAWNKFPIPQSEIDQNPNLCQNPGY
jgi:hypothetical protein